eukprot:m.223458 g.223458  ORF g.223458 m.223458 type:complete len:160 (-) comp26345_c0_seq4:437-916(-)
MLGQRFMMLATPMSHQAARGEITRGMFKLVDILEVRDLSDISKAQATGDTFGHSMAARDVHPPRVCEVVAPLDGLFVKCVRGVCVVEIGGAVVVFRVVMTQLVFLIKIIIVFVMIISIIIIIITPITPTVTAVLVSLSFFFSFFSFWVFVPPSPSPFFV